jgi:hypothetical protein
MRRVPALEILALAALLAGPAAAQCPLFSSPFGLGAIDRGHIILSGSGPPSGPFVRFFEKSPQGWQAEAFFPIGDLFMLYDQPVAIDGDRALAASPESLSQAGRAFVFDRVGTQWIPTELHAPSIGPGDFFGTVVALDGDVAVLSADHWVVGGGDGHGLTHVLELQGTAWVETAVLPFNPVAIAVERSTIVLGLDDVPAGRALVFERIGGSWVQAQELVSPAGAAFGSAVALQGDTLAIGAPGYATSGGPGYVEIYRLLPGGWRAVQHVVPSDPSSPDEFGGGLALSDTTLLVGAWQQDAGRGRVYRFEHDGTVYRETASFAPEPGTTYFGRAVAFQREDAILATWSDAFVYRLGFAAASSYCPTNPNSTGLPGSLAVAGCDSVAGDLLELTASRLPPHVLGTTFFGTNTAQQPLGDGFLCVGAPLHRLPATISDSFGTLVQNVDFGSPPGSLVTAGRTWNFQVLYRDPGSAGAGLNTTDALSIGITP